MLLYSDNNLLIDKQFTNEIIFKSKKQSFDTKQSPFRILIRMHNDNERGHMIAVADNAKAIEKDWAWIEESLMKELEELDDLADKEVYAVSKFQTMVHHSEKDTDEKAGDAKYRAAARAWRQTFHPEEDERLVNCE